MSTKPQLWVSVGEASGDMLAAQVLTKLQSEKDLAVFGITGPKLAALGVESISNIDKLQVMGLTETISTLPRSWRLLQHAQKLCSERNVKAALLVDFGAFHLRLGQALRQQGIKVFHLAPPKLWAWGQWRVQHLQRSADALGVLFPFEKDFYEQHGFKTFFVGHPVADWLDFPPSRKKKKVFLLLPGSRTSEIQNHLPRIMQLLKHKQALPAFKWVFGKAPHLHWQLFKPLISLVEIREMTGPSAFDDVALACAASGTVNLELAALGIPHVVFYRTNPLTYQLAKRLIKVPWVSPVNLLANQELVPECLQQATTSNTLITNLHNVWQRRHPLESNLRAVVTQLKQPQGMALVAKTLTEFLDA